MGKNKARQKEEKHKLFTINNNRKKGCLLLFIHNKFTDELNLVSIA